MMHDMLCCVQFETIRRDSLGANPWDFRIAAVLNQLYEIFFREWARSLASNQYSGADFPCPATERAEDAPLG